MDITGTATPKYLKSYGIADQSDFMLLDADHVKALKIEGTPTTIVVDSHGHEVWRQSGIIETKQMQQLKGLLLKP